MMLREREYSIDILKFFAALLITNSHIKVYEPLYQLSTGGSIGDVLFLFCSGFTLFMGRMGRFDNWYKRRLFRIFPSVICWGILAAFVFGRTDTVDETIINGGGWFVQCILIYYILAYPIRKYASNHLSIIVIIVTIIVCLWFAFMDKNEGFMIYGWNYCKWGAFFLFFIQGAYLSIYRDRNRARPTFIKSLCRLILCVIAWYGILYMQQRYQLSVYLQLISLLPLFGISYYFFIWCRSTTMEKVYEYKIINYLFRGIGGLCFEIYLVQNTIYHVVHIPISYPYNILILWVCIFFWAYVLHVTTNFMVQTVKEMDYDWKKMIRIF